MKKISFCLLIIVGVFAAVSCSKDSDTPVEQKTDNQGSGVIEKNDTTSGTSNSDSGGNGDVVYMLPETRIITLTDAQRKLVEKSNAFSYSLFQTTSAGENQRGKSLVMSPLSVLYVLGMLNDGAAGATEQEIASLMGLEAGCQELVNGYCQALMSQAPLTDPSVTLETANFIGMATDFAVSDRYQSDMQQYYMSDVASLDFRQSAALEYVNGWCSEKTHGMIPKILDEISPATRLLLMNAVYFKATWTEKFDPADTRDETFTMEDGQTATMPLMHRKALAMYAPGTAYDILCLPYGSGSKWQMMVMLPKEGQTVDDVVGSLTTVPWTTLWRQGRMRCEVDIKMPRFSTGSDIVLNGIIAQMGAPLMFTDKADFSAITGGAEQLFVSLLKQKAAIEVSEEGTKASAVTAAVMENTAMQPDEYKKVDFHATRPFVYLIQEISSGSVFFIGTYRGN